MPFPNYAGRLLDDLFKIVVGQTGNVKPNPDDTNYPDTRTTAARATTWALFRARNELQQMRRAEEQKERVRQKKEAPKTT